MSFMSCVRTSYTPKIESNFEGIRISIFQDKESLYKLAGIYRLHGDIDKNNEPLLRALVIVIIREEDSKPISFKLVAYEVFFIEDELLENKYRMGCFNVDLSTSINSLIKGSYFIHVYIIEVKSNIEKLVI